MYLNRLAVTTDPSPDLSIVIVSYNSLSDLKRCLPTVKTDDSTVKLEMIVVDNHGKDGVADWLSSNYSNIRLIKNPANTGYAGGNNLGVAQAKGRWTLLLNPDTELATDCLYQLMDTARQHPDAFITPKLLNPDGTINACGNEMHYTGVTTCRALNKPASFCTGLHHVPLLSGAALLAPTAALQQLGPFDERYFMYFEDTYLSLRARLMGYQLLCEARAVITHHYKLGMSATKFYHLERNRLMTFGRVFSPTTRQRLLPALFVTEALMWGFALRGPAYLKARFQTYAWLWRNRQTIRQMHEAISTTQRVPDTDLMQDSLVELPFEQLVGGRLGGLLNRIISPIYKWLKPTFLPANVVLPEVTRQAVH